MRYTETGYSGGIPVMYSLTLIQFIVGEKGLEPSLRMELDFESSAAADYAIHPMLCQE